MNYIFRYFLRKMCNIAYTHTYWIHSLQLAYCLEEKIGQDFIICFFVCCINFYIKLYNWYKKLRFYI